MHPAQESLFAALAKGHPLGKKVDLLVVNDSSIFNAKVDILQLRNSDDGAAMNLQLTLVPPRILPVVPAPGGVISVARAKELVESQNASGTVDNFNAELGAQGGAYTPLIARVSFGIGGAQAEDIECDIANGLCLNLSASYLRLAAMVDPLSFKLSGRIGPNAIYELAAFVGPGYAKRNNAQRTIHFDSIPGADMSGHNGTTPVAPIPKYATRVRLMMAPDPAMDPVAIQGWTAQVVFLNYYSGGFAANPAVASWGGSVVACPLAVDNGNVGEWEIPNGAYFIAVFHQNSFALVPSLVFDLGI